MKVTFESFLQPVINQVEEIHRTHIPYASAIALTRTAAFCRKKVIDEMNRQLDRPMPRTVDERNGPLFLKTADYKKLRAGDGDYAEVRVKDKIGKSGVGGNSDPAIVWLSHLIYGGPRVEKRSEVIIRRTGKIPTGVYLVPTDAVPTDAFGNVPRGEMERVIADLKSHLFDAGQNVTDRSKTRRRARKSRRPSFYFSTWPPSDRTRHLTPGIYLRTEFGFGSAIKPAFLFVRGLPRYRRFIRFHDICLQTAQLRGPLEFRKAMLESIRNPRPGISQLFFDV